MSSTCGCCGSTSNEVGAACAACGADAGELAGTAMPCPKCGSRICHGMRWCPSCRLPAKKFGAFGADEAHAPVARRSGAGPMIVVAVSVLVVVGGAGAAAWYWMQTNARQADAAPAIASPVPPKGPAATPVVPTGPSGEAGLMADPIDGPFFREFKEKLPEDYAAMIGPLLAEIPDPVANMDRFDALLSARLEAFRVTNAAAIAAAESEVLAEMADNMLLAMRAPELCQAAIQPSYAGLSRGNVAARRLSVNSNVSIIRAVASGRRAAVTRPVPDATQVAAFSTALQAKLHARQWEAFSAGTMASLPPDEQCAIFVAFWGEIAGYPDDLSSAWTARQMGLPPQ